MPTPALTVDELIATLQKSSLPTVLVEGTSDARIYRRVGSLLGQDVGDILFCGCRNTLLEIYKRRNEITHVKTAFLADRDMWLYGNIPAEFSGIVWTHGYSIENDAYVGSPIENLLEKDELELFKKLLSRVCEWFAFEVSEFLQNRPPYVATGIGKILNNNRDDLRQEFLQERNYQKPATNLIDDIRLGYHIKLRGKTLFGLLSQIFHISNRKEKYTCEELLWICVCMARDPDHLNSLSEKLKAKLNPQGDLIAKTS